MPSPTLPPSLEVSRQDDHTVVRIVGCDSLNEFNTDMVGKQLSALVEQEDRLHLLLHLDGIHYATSSALGKLIGLHKALHQAGGQLVLLNPEPAVAEILSITRLDTVFHIRSPLDAEATPDSLPA